MNKTNKYSPIKILWLILIIYIIFFVNRSGFYSAIGNFYLGNQNYLNAQNYFEKSYKLGKSDKNFRNSYVKSLIKSPLSIETQERLEKIITDDINDSASEEAYEYMNKLKKDIHNKYPNNYIKQAPINNEILHWGNLPITYKINNAKQVPLSFNNAVKEAFDTWEKESSGTVKFQQVFSDKPNIFIDFVNRQYEDIEYGQKYVIAYTVPIYEQNKLNRMDMKLSVYDLNGNPYTPNQIYNTALHEIFHALGFMGHCKDDKNIMYMSKDYETLQNDHKKVLNDSDINTLKLFYKIKPDITNSNDLNYKYIPFFVLGDDDQINDIKEAEAKNYIRQAPTVSAGYIDLAQVLLNKHKYTLAISSLEKALRYAFNDETKRLVYYNLAVASYFDENYELALVYAKKAEEFGDKLDLHVLKGEIYIKEKNNKSAIKEYLIIIKDSPNNIDYVFNLANLYIKEKKYISARNVLKNYLRNNPQDKNNPRFKPYKILIMF